MVAQEGECAPRHRTVRFKMVVGQFCVMCILLPYFKRKKTKNQIHDKAECNFPWASLLKIKCHASRVCRRAPLPCCQGRGPPRVLRGARSTAFGSGTCEPRGFPVRIKAAKPRRASQSTVALTLLAAERPGQAQVWHLSQPHQLKSAGRSRQGDGSGWERPLRAESG